MVLESHMKLPMTEPDILEKKFYSLNWENRPKIGPKTEFFEFIEKFGR